MVPTAKVELLGLYELLIQSVVQLDKLQTKKSLNINAEAYYILKENKWCRLPEWNCWAYMMY
ncbi:hypothetical protein CMT41_14215 [Colwellia sp. MT41]|nr:hypothetical protein CMT41_14215 [Colwellia sp. MT41]